MPIMQVKRVREDDDDCDIERPARRTRTRLPDSVPTLQGGFRLLVPCCGIPERNCVPTAHGKPDPSVMHRVDSGYWSGMDPLSPEDGNTSLQPNEVISHKDFIDSELELKVFDEMGLPRLPHVELEQPKSGHAQVMLGKHQCCTCQKYWKIQKRGVDAAEERLRLEMRWLQGKQNNITWQNLTPTDFGPLGPPTCPALHLPGFSLAATCSAEQIDAAKDHALLRLSKRRNHRYDKFSKYDNSYPESQDGKRLRFIEDIWLSAQTARQSIWHNKYFFLNPFHAARKAEMASNRDRILAQPLSGYLRWTVKDGYKSKLAVAISVDDFEAESEPSEDENEQYGIWVEEFSDESDEDDETVETEGTEETDMTDECGEDTEKGQAEPVPNDS